ncbi:viperin family antiviral radical SAM protein [Spirillospora sp. NPDC049652]
MARDAEFCAPVETVNFHLWQPCNMRCGFCFATFLDVRRSVLPAGHLPRPDAERVVTLLARSGFRKITFAGGEPLLCPWLTDLVRLAKRHGVTTAIVTNGSLLDGRTLQRLCPDLDWMTISIDSLEPETLTATGRLTRGRAADAAHYRELCESVSAAGVRLKINTVVSSVNWTEDLTGFVTAVRPERWKIFQVLPVQGQNTGSVEGLQVSPEQFERFVARSTAVERHGVHVVTEDNQAMVGSYAMVDPAGRFFDATGGGYRYSEPILRVGVERALAQVHISRDKFLARGGKY